MASYVIVTAAHNEEDSLDRLAQHVVAQTAQPLLWIIVSDGSTDRTDDIAGRYARDYSWIRFLRREKDDHERRRVEKTSPGKVAAIRMAMKSLEGLHYDYFANLDADLTFDADYYERLLSRMESDNSIGIAGGMILNILPDGRRGPGGFKNPDAVGGPTQVFRRQCYTDIGGYKPYGQDDGIACDEARRKGWRVCSFPDIWAQHHVPYYGYAPTYGSKIPTCFHLGMMDYVMRIPLWFTGAMALRECLCRPPFLPSVARVLGHLWAMLCRKPRIPKTQGLLQTQAVYAGMFTRKLMAVVRALVSRGSRCQSQ